MSRFSGGGRGGSVSQPLRSGRPSSWMTGALQINTGILILSGMVVLWLGWGHWLLSWSHPCIWLDQLHWDCLGEMSKQAKYVFMFAEFPSFVSLGCVFAFLLVYTAFIRDLGKHEYRVRWGVKFTAMNFCDWGQNGKEHMKLQVVQAIWRSLD